MGSDNCKYFKKCGACQLRNMTYEEQLSFKMSREIKLLGRFCHVDEIVPMATPSAYRNKAQAIYFEQSGRVFYGIYQSSTGRTIRCEGCPVETPASRELFTGIKNLMNELKLKAYDPSTGRGFLRHVLIRQGFATGEIMVVLVGSTPAFPKEKLFVSLLTERFPQITTVVYNVNDTETPLWLTDRERVLRGNGYITDILCGCVFRISSRSFYQINPVQTGKLYTKALELAGLTGRERVLDAYSGIGTIGIIASGKAREVVCVETNKAAVTDGIWNAGCSRAGNVRFVNSDTVKFIRDAIERKERYDVVIVDPPRAGCSREFLSKLMALSPKKVIYVSCNPETLARDLSYLKGKYRVRRIVPFDMFPFTNHVETVVLMTRSK
ncbi:MAG: 23S rRNA (uracil(1939)-C(5))-methyltransferase RlmD [Clostridia bacterium]|nr:23S rRNA (uracil(1939)-C(5))-methyltransferase RlmD [Clostridia bacterium]